MLSLRSKVRWWAIYSRGFVLILQLLSNLALPDHASSDTFTWVTVNPDTDFSQETIVDQLVSFLLDGFVRWDAHYFLHVANNGYTYESNLAFFPLFPLLVQSLANGAHWILADLNIVTYVSLLKLCAFYVNLVAFVLAADVLYSLSRRVLRDEYLAYKAALLFCVNPASVFFSAPYSESVFALFTFAAMLTVERGMGVASGTLLALASAARANGVVSVGFVIYRSMKIVATQTILYVRTKKRLSAKRPMATAAGGVAPAGSKVQPMDAVTNIATKGLFPGMLNIILGIGSFAAFQWFAYTTFCRTDQDDLQFPTAIIDEARANNYVMPSAENSSVWCFNDPPISYMYVQSHYWNVGFLNYWDGKQYPQFILAAPAIGLTIWQLYLFLNANFRYATRLGLVDNTHLGLSKPRDPPATLTLSLPRPCLVYILHAAFLAVFGLTCIHVQVTTRLICSSSPVLYWFSALLTTPSESELVPIDVCADSVAGSSSSSADADVRRKVWLKVERLANLETRHATILLQESKGSDASNWIKMYFLGYTLLGTVLFSNNYPWT